VVDLLLANEDNMHATLDSVGPFGFDLGKVVPDLTFDKSG